ncbi:hypothetical protein [Parasitella parasitica]|uniref:Uncharacterized protein n=1 Tax=Parasitella parasitica TaxID=35722 RepID=A0A0B7N7X3_9FUNG|nr:hypothetical protein [Parasitella parasitica]
MLGDSFYLRLHLTRVAGSSSFEDLRTVNNIICDTFKKACLLLHLIDDDQEWFHCFNEAITFSSGSSLRELFITALTFGQVVELVLLWEQFRNSICDDLHHKLQQQFPDSTKYTIVDESLFHNGSSSLDYGLFLIDNKLKESGNSLHEFNLPTYQNNWNEDFDQQTNRAYDDFSLN